MTKLPVRTSLRAWARSKLDNCRQIVLATTSWCSKRKVKDSVQVNRLLEFITSKTDFDNKQTTVGLLLQSMIFGK